ncbi:MULTISPECIES: rhamnogalacturonan acetylesterase [Streptomyces]|uniref:rhamnogalacturonan acetylesterase n=1 Tax=Streptomyces TaxID=1883 RepID=UPI001318FAD8|nr:MULTISPECIES: rhamnogalacturonan acetylesterase [Streptomyces]QGZ52270.1 carbohydrate esterase [Streptomyces sp. QHH-9511]GGT86609.1 rhamnogalacturonan acetylesterase [Streptomyces lateritius]
MRRTALLTVATTAAALLTAAPAHADGGPYGQGLDHCAPSATTQALVCHFDVPPGTYDVTVTLGGRTAGSTSVTGETRRALLAGTDTGAGERTRRSFTVDVRDPEGEPTGPAGSPGLDLTFGGAAQRLSGVRITTAPATPRLFLVGDSTVCDQPGEPYTGWGQQLPRFLTRGVAVANHADSGESTVSYLANPALFPAVQPLIRPGDRVLIQLAHNDKQTDAVTYRANLTTLVEGVRERGGRPVLVTPIVRRWFNADGTLNNGTALLVNGLGVDHPAEIRRLAAGLGTPLIDLTALTRARVEELGPEASKALYLTAEKRDNTHTSVRGATEYAALVLGELRAQEILPERLIR